MSEQRATASLPLQRSLSYDGLKRFLDLLIASLLLLASLPLFLLITLLIKWRSPGPVFFRQERVGLGGRPFRIYKFRTMDEDAHRNGPQITSGDDARVTPLGRFLRSTKLDEIPQFINVLKGDMSLVGPRPQVPRFVREFPHDYRDLVLSVRPGITGPTQLKFRHEEQMLEGQDDPERFYIDHLLPTKCEMDAAYVRKRSLRYDLSILRETSYLFLRSCCRRMVGRAPEPAYTHAIVEPTHEAVEPTCRSEEKVDAVV